MLLRGQARGRPRRRRRSGSPSTRSQRGCGRGLGPPHDRPRAGLSRDRGTVGAAHPRARLEAARPGAPRGRAAAGAAAGRRGAGRRRPTRSRPRTGPSRSRRCRSARRRLAFEELFLFQLALVMRRRTPQRDAARPSCSARPATSSGAGSTSLPFELTDGPARGARRRSTPTSRAGRPMQRLLMGEVGLGQDRRRALRDAAGRRGGHAGGADGAHRDARRAALRDDRRA